MSAKNKTQKKSVKRSMQKKANPLAGVGASTGSLMAPAVQDAISKDNTGYGKSFGMGAGGGALAGIPIALLAHALVADKKKRTLRDYLKSALLGGLVGGAAGGIGGLGLRAYLKSDPELAKALDSSLESHRLNTMNKVGPDYDVPPDQLDKEHYDNFGKPPILEDTAISGLFGMGQDAFTRNHLGGN